MELTIGWLLWLLARSHWDAKEHTFWRSVGLGVEARIFKDVDLIYSFFKLLTYLPSIESTEVVTAARLHRCH